ncbi:hypothetical protein [Streptomyces sp. NPDC001500]
MTSGTVPLALAAVRNEFIEDWFQDEWLGPWMGVPASLARTSL